MGHKYAEIAFTSKVKQEQEKQNSRKSYASMEQGDDVNFLLSQREADFIQARDSFYMASVSETNWPYVQHRGGPEGFLRVIDAKTIGFADFSGNRQYISTGNFRTNDRVSLILMDYPNKTRLKVLGHVTVVDDDWELLAQFEDSQYRAQVERVFLIKIDAFDWNCPQHITPRFTDRHVEELLEPLQNEIAELKRQLTTDSSNHSEQTNAAFYGTGPLKLKVTGVRQLTPDIRAFELRSSDGRSLPAVEAGSHLKIPLRLEDGTEIYRHYSICSNPARRDIYEIAVKQEKNGQGGSRAAHRLLHIDVELQCDYPKNNFALEEGKTPIILIAGGIGITAIKPMAQKLKIQKRPFELHYLGNNEAEMAFSWRLKLEFNNELTIYDKSEGQRLNIESLIQQAPKKSRIYVCGPERLLSEIKKQINLQRPSDLSLHFERFSPVAQSNAKPVKLTLNRTQKTIEVASDTTLLEAILAEGIDLPYSCKTGICGSCKVKVIEGKPEHNDEVLSKYEKENDKLMCPCISRASSDTLVIDL
ncbi:2Fe-2S iron-sulfur cluster-binding protein [Pleionea sediminis]|uniref:2Fe-2S iron-sulfur cluster-binding protein n=1 Tax=Pleionea sediminis TaxID=2569479 RepID=UPI001186EB27|nr:2Fe-2S iron-sulfur cluster-binding protein [Pleionea sediminis]